MQNIYNNCFELLTIVNCYFKAISDCQKIIPFLFLQLQLHQFLYHWFQLTLAAAPVTSITTCLFQPLLNQLQYKSPSHTHHTRSSP